MTRSSFPPRLAPLVDNDDHGFAYVGNVLVQVRRGQLTLDLLDMVVSHGRSTRLQHGGGMCLLGVIEEQAPVPDSAVRKRQAEVAASMLADPTSRAAIVVLGQSTTASLKRAVMRLVVSGRHARQCRIFDDIEPAIGWLDAECGLDAVAVRAMIARLRRALRASAPRDIRARPRSAAPTGDDMPSARGDGKR